MSPRKSTFNIKALISKARKLAFQEVREESKAVRREDKKWRELEKPKSLRAARKHREEAERRVQAAAWKADNRRLAEQEKEELERLEKERKKKLIVPKMTEAERRFMTEEVAKAREESKRRMRNRCTAEGEYNRMVSVTNNNRDDSVIEASTIEGAIAALTVTLEENLAMPVVKNSRHNNRIDESHKERKSNAIGKGKMKSKKFKFLDDVDFVGTHFHPSDVDEDEAEYEEEEEGYDDGQFEDQYRPCVQLEEYFNILIKV